MAISFVGSKTFTHAATSAQSCSLTDLVDSSGVTASLAQGDIVVVTFVQSSSGSPRTLAQCTPSGYTNAHASVVTGNDSNNVAMAVTYKFMGATPDTSVSIPLSPATSAGVAVVIEAFRGVDQTTPMDVTATTASGQNTGIANPPSITPVTSGAWIVGCAGAAVAAGAVFTNTGSPGYSTATNLFRSVTITSTANDANAAMGVKTDWTSGAFDAAALGGSTSTNTGSWGAVSIALRPSINNSTLSGSLDFTGSSTGTVSAPAVTATGSGFFNVAVDGAGSVGSAVGNLGTLSGTIALTGTSTGAVPVRGTVSGTLPITGLASNETIVTATGSGRFTVFVTATASNFGGIVSGSLSFAGSSTGQVKVQGTASPTFSVTGSSTGTVGLGSVVSGTIALTGSATGTVRMAGVGAGTFDVTGAATGGVRMAGTVSGTLPLVGSASTTSNRVATVAGDFTVTGTFTGAVPRTGAISGSLAFAGTAAGVVPLYASVSATINFTGTTAGTITGKVGVLDGLFPLTGSAEGELAAGLWVTINPTPATWTVIDPPGGVWTVIPGG